MQRAGCVGASSGGYVAKYVTKSLHDFRISARRLWPEAICELAVSAHVRAILTTIAGLADHGVAGIGKWLHTLGYRGHITTKSRRYSTTLTALRAARVEWTRQRLSDMGDDRLVGDLTPQHDPAYPVPKDVPGRARERELGETVWEFDRAAHIRQPLDTPLCSASSATPTARLPRSSRQWSLAWPSQISQPHCDSGPPSATS